jgi:hypothetical protein
MRLYLCRTSPLLQMENLQGLTCPSSQCGSPGIRTTGLQHSAVNVQLLVNFVTVRTAGVVVRAVRKGIDDPQLARCAGCRQFWVVRHGARGAQHRAYIGQPENTCRKFHPFPTCWDGAAHRSLPSIRPAW